MNNNNINEADETLQAKGPCEHYNFTKKHTTELVEWTEGERREHSVLMYTCDDCNMVTVEAPNGRYTELDLHEVNYYQ